jgi:hypothetical protein
VLIVEIMEDHGVISARGSMSEYIDGVRTAKVSIDAEPGKQDLTDKRMFSGASPAVTPKDIRACRVVSPLYVLRVFYQPATSTLDSKRSHERVSLLLLKRCYPSYDRPTLLQTRTCRV